MRPRLTGGALEGWCSSIRYVRLLGAIFLAVLFAYSCASVAAQEVPEKPNILLIMTDDQAPSTLEYMPNVQALAQEGRVFTNTVNVYPLCCPARATIQRGQYAHNHHLTANEWPHGGYQRFRADGLHKSTVATWLDDAGYETAYFGKYMNRLPATERVPGWDTFKAWADVKGGWKVVGGPFVPDKRAARLDTGTASRAAAFLEQAHEEPFFAFASFRAPHEPYFHPRRYNNLYRGVQAPRTPDLNEADVSDKPAWIRSRPPFGAKKMAAIDSHYRRALRSLAVVDGFVKTAVETLRAEGELDNTYIVFTTDNGVHTGLHRLGYGKKTAYESDMVFPMVIRGPGVAPGTETRKLVGNHDIAPTLAEIAQTSAPEFVDGRSIVPLFAGEPASWRTAILSENVAHDAYRDSPRWTPTWEAVRTEEYTYVEYASGERELYDLSVDPYELGSLAGTMPELEAALSARLQSLKGCAGDSCGEAEGP